MPLAAISDEKSVIARKLLFLATFFFFSGGWIAALNPARHLSQYGHTAWRIQDGYFSGQARAIAQTKDGYIWIGTAGGLFRFDGVRFIPWAAPDEKELPSPDVYSLLGAADGSLWVGTRHGLFRWKDGHLTNFADATGRINAILEDRAGAVWIARTRIDPPLGPMCKVADNSLRCYGASDGLSCLYGNSLANADNGSLWIGSSEAICNWTPASSRTYLQKELAQTEGLTGVGAVVTKGDPVWAGIARAGKGLGLQQFIDGAWRDYTVPGLDGTTIAVNSLLVDRSNALWIGTVNQGIYRVLDGKAEHFRSADGLSSDAVSNIYEDVEGDIWVATSKGVDRFHDVSVASFSASEGLTTDSVSSVLASRGGTVWIGNEGALDFIEKNGLSRITPREGLPGHDITSLFEDHAGKLWLGVDNELAVYDRGQFRLIRRSNGTGVGVVARLTEDIDRNIWAYVVGKGAGLLRIRQFHIEEEFPSVQYIVSLAPDPGGGIWMGLIEGGLQRYTKGTFEDFPFPKNVGAALDLLADADGSIWVATQKNGLMRWKKGDLEFLTTKNGLPCDEIFSLIRDKAGSLWIYSKCGLLEIADSELKNWLANPRSAVKVGTYDVLDGAQPALPSFRPISSMSPDGQLWFANESVLQTIDPSHLASNLLPPPVHIEEVVADRRTHSPQETLRFPPHTRDLEIDYTALSFVVPQKVLFRYILEGHDASWQDPGTRRQAFYNDLRPGHYRFRVIACNNDGVWNQAGASLDFSILPAYYQTTWFRAFCAAAFLVLMWVIYQIRVRQLHHQFEIGVEARVNERTRIARDLHDTLLQTLHGLMFQFQAVRNLMPRKPDEAMRSLDDAINETEKALAEGRNAIQGLRSEPITESDLADLLKATSQELAASGAANPDSADQEPPVFDLIEEGERRTLSPATKNEICRIAFEILRNAYRHSYAHRIEAEIRYDDRMLRVRIRDDGSGIDPKVLKEGGRAGHWGLRGLRERTERMGAHLDFWSEAGAGTEVQLSVPAAVAYEASRESVGSRLFRKVTNRGQRS